MWIRNLFSWTAAANLKLIFNGPVLQVLHVQMINLNKFIIDCFMHRKD